MVEQDWRTSGRSRRPRLGSAVGRSGGRRRQEALFVDWGGAPITQLLRFRTGGSATAVLHRHEIVSRAKERGGLDLGEDEVLLTHLRQVRTGEHTIKLAGTEEPLVPFTGDGDRVGHEDEKGRVSEVIEVLNERFASSSATATSYFEQIEATLAEDAELTEQAQANEIDNFRFGFEQKFEAAVIDRQFANEEPFNKIMDDPEFSSAIKDLLLQTLHKRLSGQDDTAF